MAATFSGSPQHEAAGVAAALELVQLLNEFVDRDILPLNPILNAELFRCLALIKHAPSIGSGQSLSTACANPLQLMNPPQGQPKDEAQYVAIPPGLAQYRMENFNLILLHFLPLWN